MHTIVHLICLNDRYIMFCLCLQNCLVLCLVFRLRAVCVWYFSYAVQFRQPVENKQPQRLHKQSSAVLNAIIVITYAGQTYPTHKSYACVHFWDNCCFFCVCVRTGIPSFIHVDIKCVAHIFLTHKLVNVATVQCSKHMIRSFSYA